MLAAKVPIYQSIQKKYLSDFHIVDYNWDKPWGGYFVIDSRQIAFFKESFFADLPKGACDVRQPLCPKLLVVEPGKRLSWQYHYRRAEWWKILDEPAAVAMSDTDQEPEAPVIYATNSLIRISLGTRHRLIGLKSRAVVAEIWEHTDIKHLSNEEDIVRVQDDFKR